MAPEYGATCGFFPVDEITLGYLRLSGRPESTVKLVEAYSKEQGLWREKGHEPVFTDTLHLDMGEVEASLAGPKRPQDRVALQNVASAFNEFIGLQLHPPAPKKAACSARAAAAPRSAPTPPSARSTTSTTARPTA